VKKLSRSGRKNRGYGSKNCGEVKKELYVFSLHDGIDDLHCMWTILSYYGLFHVSWMHFLYYGLFHV
jgi:hypothetical protein